MIENVINMTKIMNKIVLISNSYYCSLVILDYLIMTIEMLVDLFVPNHYNQGDLDVNHLNSQ